MSTKMKKIAIGIAALVVLALGGAAIAQATGVGDDKQSLTGSTAAKASAAALKATGGGRVTGSERDNEKGATYEVEVKKPDGSTVDVRLDESFKVIVVDSDSEQADDNGGSDDGPGDE
jgi:uncharacterized membrane protein YkoI